jgi:hypothetical protein
MIDHSALVKYAGKSVAIERNRLKGAQLRGGETEVIEHDLACAERIYQKLARQNVSAVKLAGILSNDSWFWKFLEHLGGDSPYKCEIKSKEDAADFIRDICCVVTRKDLRYDEEAQKILKELNQQFKDWRRFKEC